MKVLPVPYCLRHHCLLVVSPAGKESVLTAFFALVVSAKILDEILEVVHCRNNHVFCLIDHFERQFNSIQSL
jgi:hypothetical protein